jgi:hypothetical protein
MEKGKREKEKGKRKKAKEKREKGIWSVVTERMN